jgi:hypothetical protein
VQPVHTEVEATTQAEGMVERMLRHSRHREDAESGTALRRCLSDRSAYLPAAVPEDKARLEAMPESRMDDVSRAIQRVRYEQ